ncbi:hypothetical protein ASPBRDRAFT_198822 [Aspergillus brasiliensis CBS 101740]|uniref:RNase III domain-containing protein n=1 Tax=Aspergillus brasiliensis (strain CBS 101740 / IMI 381727 / IBT 21946) TaxID=767769 RepID=A0A1L9U9M9_ASPBC|nr:hypothetical protein ASPBRDRAFT_198822 [Aspergillus brasiliensis CBS 101740]
MPSLPVITDRVESLQHIIGYTFNDPKHAMEALVAPGNYIPGFINRMSGNKDLAQLGESVLKMTLILDGYEAGKSRESIDQEIKANSKNHLTAVGFNLGLDAFVIVNPAQGRVVSTGVMAETIQALIGAVFIDSGHSVETVRPLVAKLGLGWPA